MRKDFFCGVDVSKAEIDICFLTSVENHKAKFDTLPNNYEVIKAYFESFKNDDILVVFEATSKIIIYRFKRLYLILKSNIM
jgi:putative pilin inverting protein